jgi:putative transposase
VEKAAPPFTNDHFVWISRYREKVHTGPVFKRSKEIFEEIAVELGFENLVLDIPDDNVHMFVSSPPNWSPAKIVHRFKGRSPRPLMKKYIHLRKVY